MKTIIIDGITYKLVPLKDEKTDKTILDDYLSPPGKDKDLKKKNPLHVKPKGIPKAVGKVSKYREKFINKKLTPLDFPRPKMSKQDIIKPNQTQMDTLANKAGEDVWFGAGVQQTW